VFFWRAMSVVVIPLAALGQQQNPSPRAVPQMFRISGTVVNAITGQFLSKIEVSIGPAEKPGSQNLVTADDGRFSFEGLTPRKYWLEAEGHGFSRQRFDQHEDFSTAIAVGPNVDAENLIFRMKPDATVAGTVSDQENEPVRDARVMLFRTGVQNGTSSTQLISEAQSDDQGHYRFGHVAAGTFLMAVSARPWYGDVNPRYHDGVFVSSVNHAAIKPADTAEAPPRELDVTYPITFYAGATDPKAATPLSIKAGDHLQADIALAAVPALHLRIRSSSIDPGQRVEASLTEHLFGAIIPVSAQSGQPEKGELEISGVAPGEYSLLLRTWGKISGSRSRKIEVSGNMELDASESSPSPAVGGTVKLDNGRPLPRPLLVSLFDPESRAVISGQTALDGEFEINGENAKPGKYEVSVFGVPGAIVKTVSATGAAVIGHEVEIGAGAAVRLSLLVSQGVERVNGTVRRDDKPFAGAMVVLVPQDIEHNSTLVRRDQSDSDGTFSLYNVLPGRYTVVAIENGWDLQWLAPGVLQPYFGNGMPVDVSPGAKYNITVKLQ
jgi:Carboxypeptidase regulatory-like domain